MNINYFDKYIKYKNKYLNLKIYNNKILIGGSLYIDDENIKFINRFNTYDDNGKDMEKFLNPIYGLYMHESGFISNLFGLNKLGLIKFIKTTEYIEKYSEIIS